MNRLLYLIAPPSATLEKSRPALRVFAIALAWFACTAWMRPLSLPDEGRYVGVAWEMLRSGNWLMPTLDGMPFLHKPPLFYWLTAFSLQAFGPNEWAARGASMLAAASTIAILYVSARDWLDERTARLAALVLATQPLLFGASQFANLDMLVAACISATILLGASAAHRIEGFAPYRRELAGAYVAAALGVLAKGLIGVVIPILVLALWLGLAGQWRTIRRLCWLPGLAMFAVVAMPWFAAVQWEQPGFLHYFIVVQHLQRFAGSGFNNVEPLWFYGPVLFVLVLPWSAWLLLPHLRKSRPAPPVHPGVQSLMWIWLGVVLVFFSIPQSKLIGYILPALAPVALLVACTAVPVLRASLRARRLWQASIGLAACLCVGSAIGFAIVHPKSSRELAVQLATHRGAHEGVAFIDDYSYDLSFYLRENPAIMLVSNWDPAEIQRHDDWRKELADAGSFAPELGAERLIDDARFSDLLCSGRIKWVIADPDQAQRYPFLAAAERIGSEGHRTLWHTDVSEPRFNASMRCASALRSSSPPSADNHPMQPTSDPRAVAEQMLMADSILSAFARGAMPMHAAGYQELASWVMGSFRSMDSKALRGLRDAAPPELQGIVENVLHERRAISWAADDSVGLSSLAESLALLSRCRKRFTA